MVTIQTWAFLLRYGFSLVAALWRYTNGRWFIFQDSPYTMVRVLAVMHKRWGKEVDQSNKAHAFFEAALEEYTARKRKMKIEV